MIPCALILFARYDSRRLPGKALMDVAGRPLLGRVLDRLRLVDGGGPMIVATSERAVDEPIAEFARREGMAVFRGPAEDVAGRALDCAEAFGLVRFVRISGDSPFLDPALVPPLVRLHVAKNLDLATNVFPRTYPSGMSVEVIATEALRRALQASSEPEDREHVTRYFYKHPESFAIENLSARSLPYDGIALAVDTAADLARAAWIVAHLDGPAERATLDEVVALARAWSNLDASR